MTDWDRIDDHECHTFQGAVELIGRRWNSAILLALARGATRFRDILSGVIGLSDRMLAQRLRELETAGLIEREVIPTTPVQIRYALTPAGIDLMRALQPLQRWGSRYETQREPEQAAG